MKNKYFKPTPKKWKQIQMALKGLFGSLAVSSYATDKPYLGFWLLAIGGIADMLIEVLTGDEEPPQQ